MRQFRVLYRQFLFRIVDRDLLSSHSHGDSSQLLGRFAAILLFLSLLFALGSMGISGRDPAMDQTIRAWGNEHLLIAVTMLLAGIFAVLSWDSTFPNRADLHILSPLPVQPTTIFAAKALASVSAITVVIACLHGLSGFAWPLSIGSIGPAKLPPAQYLPAMEPLAATDIAPLLRRDLEPVLTKEMGIAVGIMSRGQRTVFALGTAKPDSIFQIGTLSASITGLMALKADLDHPLRDFLNVPKPNGAEITLRDLAMSRSGLPRMPTNLPMLNPVNPGAGYSIEQLYNYIETRGVGRPAHPAVAYSNVGIALLGQILARQAHLSFDELLARDVTGPLGMRDTVATLSDVQALRLIRPYSPQHEPLSPWEIGSLAPAGGLYSTAADLLQLMNLSPDLRPASSISGYGVRIATNPKDQYAIVVLTNQRRTLADGAITYVEQRLRGQPAMSFQLVSVPHTGLLRSLVVYWIVMWLSGIFVFSSVVLVQGLAEQILPRIVFLRASGLLQLAAFCAIVCGFALQPGFNGQTLLDANSGSSLAGSSLAGSSLAGSSLAGSSLAGSSLGAAWSPPLWFLGLFQMLNGSPALGGLAHRAVVALATVFGLTAMIHALAYARTMRRIAEEPDIAPARLAIALPGTGFGSALIQFTIRTLLRSRRHRLILAFYLGIGFALVVLMVKLPHLQQQVEDIPVSDPWNEANAPVLAASMAFLIFAILGVRVVLSLPTDLDANWIFRITGTHTAGSTLKATRAAMLLLSVAPPWILTAAACLFLQWPIQPALGHLAIMAVLGSFLVDASLIRFRKVPFTCSFLAGKTQLHIAVLAGIAGFYLLRKAALYEKAVLIADPQSIAYAVLTLAAAAIIARWATDRSVSGKAHSQVTFTESLEPAITVLRTVE